MDRETTRYLNKLELLRELKLKSDQAGNRLGAFLHAHPRPSELTGALRERYELLSKEDQDAHGAWAETYYGTQ